MEFRDRLRAELDRSGMTQQKFADHIEVSFSTLCAWLRGSEPGVTRYERLLKVLPGLRDEVHS